MCKHSLKCGVGHARRMKILSKVGVDSNSLTKIKMMGNLEVGFGLATNNNWGDLGRKLAHTHHGWGGGGNMLS
jgi:hypothetical protein